MGVAYISVGNQGPQVYHSGVTCRWDNPLLSEIRSGLFEEGTAGTEERIKEKWFVMNPRNTVYMFMLNYHR